MKSILSFTLIVFSCFVLNAQTIESLAETLSEEVYKQLKRKPIPTKSKLAVCFFIGEQGTNDDIHSPLGIKIANQFAITLKREFQNKKRLENIEIILNDKVGKVLNSEMQGTFIPPDNMEAEEKFWKQLKNNERPDYFISGKYEIVGDFNSIKLKNVRLEKNKFNTNSNDQGYRPPVFEDIDIQILSQKEKERFKVWNSPIKNVPKVYSDFMQFQGTQNIMNFDIIYGSNEKNVPPKEPLKLNRDYQFKLSLKEDAYIYAFYYESEDLLDLHMFMLYPISKNEDNFCKAGIINLPRLGSQEFMFTPSPPISGQVLIKVVASKKKLAINFTETPDGYIHLNQAQCEQFLNQLKKIGTSNLQTFTVVKGLE